MSSLLEVCLQHKKALGISRCRAQFIVTYYVEYAYEALFVLQISIYIETSRLVCILLCIEKYNQNDSINLAATISIDLTKRLNISFPLTKFTKVIAI